MKACILISLLLISFAAQATGGTVRFSGRITDPPCVVGQASNSAQEIVLDRCPLSAQGARILVTSLDAAAPAQLTDTVAGRGAAELSVSAHQLASNALSFSGRYRLSASGSHSPASGTYLVMVDYP
jgi:type 1 fimbria pilin